ncbi:type VI secretion system lipoprotein TssJ [Serratia fonticola]|uniref:type VI secretion system lipoprotein TssJ n=1 Tax=Serratia fonticola TaxID=47917 RepID=UPI003BB58B32
MRNRLLIPRLSTLMGWALLGGCSWFSSAPDIPPQQRQITLQLNAGPGINPGTNGRTQPVKICIIEANAEGWSPPGLFQGTPCSDINIGDKVVSVSQHILVPGQKHLYRHEVPFDQNRWLVIAAEFQRFGEGKNFIQLQADARTDFNPVVHVEGNTLTRLPDRTPDVLKDK